MSSIHDEELRLALTARAQRAQLARRRRDFLRRLQERPLAQAPKEKHESLFDRVTPDILGLAAGQIASTIKETPRGIYELAKAPTLDLKDLITEGDVTPERIGGLAKGMGQQLYEDVRHPLRNPGYLALDIVSLLPTPAAGVSRTLRSLRTFKAAKQGLPIPEPRSYIGHDTSFKPVPGETEGFGHEAGYRRDPDTPTNAEVKALEEARKTEPARKKYATVEDVKKDFVRMKEVDPVTGKLRNKDVGIVGQMNPFDESGTQYVLHRSPRGEYTVLRYEGGKPEVQEQIGDVTSNSADALRTLFEQHVSEAHSVGKFAPEPREPYTGPRVEEFNAENRQLVQQLESRKAIDEERGVPGKTYDEMRPDERLEHLRQYVLKQPGEKMTQKKLMELGVPDKKTAKAIQQQLYDAGVITKAGTASRTALIEQAELEGLGYRGGMQKGESGVTDLDDLDALVHPELSDDITPYASDAEEAAAHARLHEDDYEPVEIRYDENGDRYVHSGLQTLMDARNAGVEKLRYQEMLEPQKASGKVAEGPAKPFVAPVGTIAEDVVPTKAKPLTDEQKFDSVKRISEVTDGSTPTVAQIQRKLKVKKGEAEALRAKFIAERVDPEALPGVKPGWGGSPRNVKGAKGDDIPRVKREYSLEKNAQRARAKKLVFERGATAKQIADDLKISISAARKLRTEIGKERAKMGPKTMTPHERTKAEGKVAKLWEKADKPPTIAAIKAELGVGDVSAAKIRKAVAEEKNVDLTPKKTLREDDVNPRKLGVNQRTLTAAGVEPKWQKSLRDRITKLYRVGEKAPDEAQLREVFQLVLGKTAGDNVYAKWKTIRGGSGPMSTREALKLARAEFFRPNRGGTTMIALQTRNRATRRPLDIVDEETGLVSKPATAMYDTGNQPTPAEFKELQTKGAETVAVEVALSNNVAIKAFQQHRYKWMAKEQSSRVARVYARVIRAGNVGENSQAMRHVNYQLRNLDRVADAIEQGKLKPLGKVAFREAIKKEFTAGQARSSDKGKLGRTIDTVNQMAIIATLYMKPAYIPPNLLGQGFLVMADHYMNPLNVIRSMRLHKELLGRKEYHSVFKNIVEAGMGKGIIGGIEVKGGASKKIAATHHVMSTGYSWLMDDWFRQMSFLNEAHRHGFDSAAKIKSLAEPRNKGKLTEILQRANKNIIDFGDISKTESTYHKRLIFFYPWIKASSMYTARFPTQHPFQAAAIGGASIQGREKTEKELGPLPSYLEGYFQGPDVNIPGFGNLSERTMPDGSKKPRVFNPASASVFGSLGEVIDMVKANVLGHVRDSDQASDFLSPALSLTSSIIFRRDPFTGREYRPDQSMLDILGQEAMQYSAVADAFLDTKQARKYASGEKDSEEVLFPYTAGERIARYVGGVTPYTLNTKVARSRAQAEQRGFESASKRETTKSLEERKELLENAKKTGMIPQGEKQLPKALRDAYTIRARREANLAAYEEELGRKLKNVDRLYADLSLLTRMGRMPEAAAKAILEQTKLLPDPMIDAVARQVRETHFSSTLISAWKKAINARLNQMGLEEVG